jgi:hypothetical protein
MAGTVSMGPEGGGLQLEAACKDLIVPCCAFMNCLYAAYEEH